MINLRKATNGEAEPILKFYQNVIESIEDSEFEPKWGRHYPNLEFIKTSIEKQELYVYTNDKMIIASVVLNNRFNPEYENINWICNSKPQETIIIHTFAVTPDYAGKGIGKEIFNQIKDDAVKKNKKTIRLDIINGNTGAQKVFERLGFKYIDTVELFHDAVGLEKFHLYEYNLKNEK